MSDWTEEYFNLVVPDEGQEEEKKLFMESIKRKDIDVVTLGFLFDREEVERFGRDNLVQKLLKKTGPGYIEVVKELRSSRKVKKEDKKVPRKPAPAHEQFIFDSGKKTLKS